MRFGEIYGIKVELHWSFILLFFLLVLALALFDLKNFIGSIILFSFLFLSVFFHELSHSIIALSKGIKVKKIILLPIGGVSVSEGLIEKPKDEFLIAIAGPLFNFLVVIIILILSMILPLNFPFQLLRSFNENLFEYAIMNYPLFALFYVNLILGLFNLFVPALPMDGGRVLRSLLAMFLGNLKATRIASKVSKFIAVFMFLVGFFIGNIILILIAVFVFIGAQQEANFAVLKEEIRKLELHDLINFAPLIINETETIKDAFNLMRLYKKEFLLVHEKKGYFYVTLSLISSIPQNKWQKKVSLIAKKAPEIKLTEKPEKLVNLMLLKNMPLVAVTKENELIGVIEKDNLQQAIEFQKIKELK